MTMTPAKAMEAQFRIAKRLKEHGVIVYFMGTADMPEQCIPIRWEVLRTAIVDFRLSDTPYGKRADGTEESYREAYERLTGEPLIPAKERAA